MNSKPTTITQFSMVILIAGLFQLSYGCSETEEVVKEPETEEETSPVQWKVTEIEFTSGNSYSNSFNDLDLDVVFMHSGGAEIKVPAFWNSGKNWMVRFAPTLTGKWTYKTVCTDESNSGLHNQTGEIDVEAYNGDLEIYTRGFVNAEASKRYFSFNDGTPFFYLGDTHWNMPVKYTGKFQNHY